MCHCGVAVSVLNSEVGGRRFESGCGQIFSFIELLSFKRWWRYRTGCLYIVHYWFFYSTLNRECFFFKFTFHIFPNCIYILSNTFECTYHFKPLCCINYTGKVRTRDCCVSMAERLVSSTASREFGGSNPGLFESFNLSDLLFLAFITATQHNLVV